MPHPRSPWTDETVAGLRALWAEGLSTAKIGERMNISKNSVVRKSHRLGLAARPSPIIRDGIVRRKRIRRARKNTLTAVVDAPDVQPAPFTPAVVRSQYTARVFAPVGACCWPIGEPSTPSFRFCDDTPVVGKPYCSIHCRAAYLPPSRVNTDGIFRDEPGRAFVGAGQ